MKRISLIILAVLALALLVSAYGQTRQSVAIKQPAAQARAQKASKTRVTAESTTMLNEYWKAVKKGAPADALQAWAKKYKVKLTVLSPTAVRVTGDVALAMQNELAPAQEPQVPPDTANAPCSTDYCHRSSGRRPYAGGWLEYDCTNPTGCTWYKCGTLASGKTRWCPKCTYGTCDYKCTGCSITLPE